MGDFACFRLYSEVNAFKTFAESFIIPVMNSTIKKITTAIPGYLLKRR
jgi:hypothetical protein